MKLVDKLKHQPVLSVHDHLIKHLYKDHLVDMVLRDHPELERDADLSRKEVVERTKEVEVVQTIPNGPVEL